MTVVRALAAESTISGCLVRESTELGLEAPFLKKSEIREFQITRFLPILDYRGSLAAGDSTLSVCPIHETTPIFRLAALLVE